jgi:DNA-binding transcriptional MerR regulator
MAMLGAAQKSPEAFRTISEVAAELDVPQHVLRFWETKFTPVKPLKRGGGRRYYRPDDLDLLRGIRTLLYSDGLTIKGVQKILREQGARYVMELGRGGVSLIRASRVEEAEDLARGEEEAEPMSSNVHPFRRDAEPLHDAAAAIADEERDRFSALLDELSDLKERLRKARRGTPISH